jgi:hypothetical protein
MKQALSLVFIALLAVAGCKKDDGSPTGDVGGGTTTAFEFVAGHAWTYNEQAYQVNGTPLPNTALQASLSVLATGQTIGGIPQAAVLRMGYTQGGSSPIGTLTVAYNQDRFLIYNGAGSTTGEWPAFPGWNVLFDFTKNTAVRSILSFDSTFQLTMRSGGLLRDRVRYNATMAYAGEEPVAAFNTASVACSKYLYTFTYDAVIDTGGVSLFNGNLITATITIWFSPTIGFVKLRGDATYKVKLQSLNDLKIGHDPGAYIHVSPGLTYYSIYSPPYFTYEFFSLQTGGALQSAYAVFDGFTKSF